MNALQVVILVLLVMVANLAPAVTDLLMGRRWNAPLDGGLSLPDRRPLFGPTKTIRGVIASVLATGIIATLVGLSPAVGAGFACLAMAGDIGSSFMKRRLGIASSRSVPVLDQLPEALLPLYFMQSFTGGTLAEILVAAGIFSIIDLVLSKLYRPA